MAEEVSLYVALYIDEDITNQLAALISQRGFRAVSAVDVGMVERSDEEHLEYASARSMTLFTYNERDYIELARSWMTTGPTHSGILISDQFSLRQMGELLRRTLNFLDRVTANEMTNVVRYLSDFK
jgi:predicted nuclease of predicted toxin-antitoxin system